jgi:hypothetical protein
LGVAAAVLVLATALGAAFAPYLAVHHPYWLLALNPWPRHQILVAPHTTLEPFIAVVAPRALYACWVTYELGKHYGARGSALLEGRAPSLGHAVRMTEQLFERCSGLALLFMPGILTSALAGKSGFLRWQSLALSALGLMTWAWINHQVGGWLEPWTAPVLRFFHAHMLSATAACVLGVGLYQLMSHRKPRSSDDLVKRSDQDSAG